MLQFLIIRKRHASVTWMFSYFRICLALNYNYIYRIPIRVSAPSCWFFNFRYFYFTLSLSCFLGSLLFMFLLIIYLFVGELKENTRKTKGYFCIDYWTRKKEICFVCFLTSSCVWLLVKWSKNQGNGYVFFILNCKTLPSWA